MDFKRQPWQELQAQHAHLLGTGEKALAPGTSLSFVQPDPPAETHIGKRPIRDVEALVAEMEQRWSTRLETRSDFDHGVHTTFLWALGRGAAAFTQAAGPPTAAQLLAEDDAAYAEIYSPDRAVKQGFAVGVQHAALWLRGRTLDAPWSI